MSTSLALLRELCDCHDRISKQADALDWDGVTTSWREAEQLFSALSLTPLADIPASERDEARQRIEQLLASQKKITARISPWMEQVRPLLETFSRHPLQQVPEDDQKRPA